MAHDNHSHGPVDDPNFVNDRNYETRDFFAFNSVLKWIFCLFVFVGIAATITYGIYRFMVPPVAERSSAFPLPQVRALPPDPRLQANPVLDIRTFREQEAAAVTSYGVDPKTRAVHIPVDQAIDIVSQEGLPTRANAAEASPEAPNEPSSTEGQAPAGSPNTMPASGSADTAPVAPPTNSNAGVGATRTPGIPTDINSASGGQVAQPGTAPGR